MSKNEVTPVAPGVGPACETIKCAAIARSDGIIIAGRNHAFCFKYSPDGTCKKNSQQGFVTSTARFVGRQEAGRIAYAAGQIPKPIDILFSEEITGDNPWAGEIIKQLQAELDTANKEAEAGRSLWIFAQKACKKHALRGDKLQAELDTAKEEANTFKRMNKIEEIQTEIVQLKGENKKLQASLRGLRDQLHVHAWSNKCKLEVKP